MDRLLQIPIKSKNPCDFCEGSIIRSKYTDIAYRVVRHSRNGMTTLLRLDSGVAEEWNGHNNAHFIPADFVNISTLL